MSKRKNDMKLFRVFLLSLAVMLTSNLSLAAQEKNYSVRFQSGQSSAVIKGSLTGREVINYKVSARAGQILKVSLSGSNPQTYFNVFLPGAYPNGAAYAVSSQTSPRVPTLNRFQTALPSNGSYTISVYLFRAAAQRGDYTSYTLDIGIDNGGTATQLPLTPGEGPAVGGGAGFSRVTGVGSSDRLNVRRGPSTANAVLFRIRNGEVVRNHGCTSQSGSRWCKVNRISHPSVIGWASARYLVAASNPGSAQQLPGGGATQLPGSDALVPGSNFHATGTIPCASRQGGSFRNCRYGVIRHGRGNATVVITMANGTTRRIEFEGGRPVSSNSSAGIFGEHINGMVVVSIGTNETYRVVDEIMFGG